MTLIVDAGHRIRRLKAAATGTDVPVCEGPVPARVGSGGERDGRVCSATSRMSHVSNHTPPWRAAEIVGDIRLYVITYSHDDDRAPRTDRAPHPGAARRDGAQPARPRRPQRRQRADAQPGRARRDEPDARGRGADRVGPRADAVAVAAPRRGRDRRDRARRRPAARHERPALGPSGRDPDAAAARPARRAVASRARRRRADGRPRRPADARARQPRDRARPGGHRSCCRSTASATSSPPATA